MNRLTNSPEIQVKVCQEYGNRFKSTVDIMQDDCLSTVLFIYYLAKCLKEEQTQMHGFYLCPKYADDITHVTTSLEKIEEIERDTPPKLKSYNLQVNQSKTKKYQIPRPIPENQHKSKCVMVRTGLDSQHTTCDIRKHINKLEGMQTSGNKARHQCRHKKTQYSNIRCTEISATHF